jgi:hypothetical protein
MLLATWKVREHALKRQIVEQVIRSQDQAFDVCSLQGNLAGFQWAMSTVESLLAGLSQDLEMMVEQRKMEE